MPLVYSTSGTTPTSMRDESHRTAMRPIPRGKVSRPEGIAAGAVADLGLALSPAAAALLVFTFFFVVHTIGLKRHPPQNIVIGDDASHRRSARSCQRRHWAVLGRVRDATRL